MVARACVHSRALLLAGTWDPLPSSSLRRISTAYNRPFRAIVGPRGPPAEGEHRMTDAAIRSMLGIARVEAAIAVEQFRTAARISRGGCTHLLALVQSEAGSQWRRQLLISLQVL